MSADVTVAVVIWALAPRNCVVAVVPNVVPVRVVMFAEVLLRLVTVPEVYVRFVPVSVVTLADVMLRLANVKLVSARFVTVAEV